MSLQNKIDAFIHNMQAEEVQHRGMMQVVVYEHRVRSNVIAVTGFSLVVVFVTAMQYLLFAVGAMDWFMLFMTYTTYLSFGYVIPNEFKELSDNRAKLAMAMLRVQ